MKQTSKQVNKKVLVGIVTSDKREKTITVKVDSLIAHPVYGKRMLVSQKYSAHDEKEIANIGDKVEIISTRPISKTKSFKLLRVVEAATAKKAVKTSKKGSEN